jgi:hypothetical protein
VDHFQPANGSASGFYPLRPHTGQAPGFGGNRPCTTSSRGTPATLAARKAIPIEGLRFPADGVTQTLVGDVQGGRQGTK